MLGSSFVRVAVAALALSACSSSPDVVATGSTVTDDKDASPYLNPIELVSGCSAGVYKGNFYSEHSADGAAGLPIDGDFMFVLEKKNAGEFLQLADNAPLTGSSKTSTPFTFDATIQGGRACVEGEFQTTLSGTFTVSQGPAIPFDGNVHGQYIPPSQRGGVGSPAPGFIGSWEIFLALTSTNPSHTRISGGYWSAVRTANP